MTENESYRDDKSALAQARFCYEKVGTADSCRIRAGRVLAHAIGTYDIIALQEATGSETILDSIHANMLNIKSQAAQIIIPETEKYEEARVCWRSDKYELEEYYQADINQMVDESIENVKKHLRTADDVAIGAELLKDGKVRTPDIEKFQDLDPEDVRPIQICIFRRISDHTKFIFINVHNTKYEFMRDSPINHILLERAISRGIDNIFFNKEKSCDFLNNIIVAGDFNSNRIWKGIFPYRYVTNGKYCGDEFKNIIVSSFDRSPIKSCCSGRDTPREESQDDTQVNDYILISNNFSFTTNNEIYNIPDVKMPIALYAPKSPNINIFSPSDHLPVMSIINVDVPRNMGSEPWYNKPEHLSIINSIKLYQMTMWYRLINEYMRNPGMGEDGLRDLAQKSKYVSSWINYVFVLFYDYNYFSELSNYESIIRYRKYTQRINTINNQKRWEGVFI
jgi:hypothetical protein